MRIKELAKQSGGSVSDLFNLPLSVLDSNPDNVRMDTEELRAHVRKIANSIKDTGFLRSRALTVRLVGDRAIVVDGNLRLMACKLAVSDGAELLTVPCVPEAPGTTPAERLANMWVSNDGLAHSPFEKVTTIKLMMSYGWDQTQIAKRLGVSRQTITNLLDLAGSSDDVRKAVEDGTISPTQAIKLVRSEGDNAAAVIADAVQRVTAAGKSRVTAKAFQTAESKSVAKTPEKGPDRAVSSLNSAARELLRIWDTGSLGEDFDTAIVALREAVA